METIASLIACCGYDQDAIVGAVPDGIGKQWVGFPARNKLTTADVDDVDSLLSSL
jgi:hypothetical protein